MTERRRLTPGFRGRMVLGKLTDVKDRADLCLEYRLSRQLFPCWRVESVGRAPDTFSTERSHGDEQERLAQLERIVEHTLVLDVAPATAREVYSAWRSIDRAR